MSQQFKYFPEVPVIPFKPGTDDALAFRHYNASEALDLGRGEPSLIWSETRHAVAIWHLIGGSSGDPFGPPTHIRPWSNIADWREQAKVKAEAVFSLWERMMGGYGYHCFHDFDWVQEAPTLRESEDRVKFVTERICGEQQRTGIQLLWGTPQLFVHPRWANGASTSPSREIWERALSQTMIALDATKAMGGLGFVLWGGRNGYTDILAKIIRRDREQMKAFLLAVLEYADKIGFTGPIFIEPKAKEPTNHQYDFDASTVIEFLCWCGIGPDRVQLNLEGNHAELATHSFLHELEVARAGGWLGSLDVNQGTPGVGWDTDEYLHDERIALGIGLGILRNGGLRGGCNVDAKPRRVSHTVLDYVRGHILSLDTLTKGVRAAAWLMKDGRLDKLAADSYASWNGAEGEAILGGKFDHAAIKARSLDLVIDAAPTAEIETIWGLLAQALEHANEPAVFATN